MKEETAGRWVALFIGILGLVAMIFPVIKMLADGDMSDGDKMGLFARIMTFSIPTALCFMIALDNTPPHD